MSNFARVLRTSLRYRYTLAGIALCSLLVGFFWGANVGAVYPFVEAVFRGDSMHDWVDRQLQTTAANIRQWEREAAELERRLAAAGPAAERAELERRRRYALDRLNAERRAHAAARRAAPYIRAYLPANPFDTLLLIVGAILASTLLKGLFLTANLVLVARLGEQTAMELRRRCFRRALEMDLAGYDEDRTGDLLSRFTGDVKTIRDGVMSVAGKSVREPLKMAACVAGAAWISWRLLLFCLVITPAAFALMYLLARSVKRANRRVMEEMSRFYQRLGQALTAIQVVKAFTAERWERGRMRVKLRQLYRKAIRVAWYNSLTRINTELLGVGVICLAVLAGGYLVLNQETHLLGIKMSDRPLSFGSLLMFYGFLIGISDPARKMADVVNSVQAAAAAADRVYAVLDRPPRIASPARPRRLPPGPRDLAFEGVSFHYRPNEPVLRDVDLDIPFGRTVAVVGPNGSGKSTLIKLIPRFYDPSSGVVRLAGTDLRQLRLRELRRQIGLVTQETLLLDDTVLNNIRYGSPYASEAEAAAAAERAGAHRFIVETLEHGYHTHLGEGGARLSGGQRQRIALARAILRNPPILILDEATSQSDLESERLIHQALREFQRGRTVIMITHRLTNIELADEVVVMDQGRIAARGPHDHLLATCPLYARLHELGWRKTA